MSSRSSQNSGEPHHFDFFWSGWCSFVFNRFFAATRFFFSSLHFLHFCLLFLFSQRDVITLSAATIRMLLDTTLAHYRRGQFVVTCSLLLMTCLQDQDYYEALFLFPFLTHCVSFWLVFSSFFFFSPDDGARHVPRRRASQRCALLHRDEGVRRPIERRGERVPFFSSFGVTSVCLSFLLFRRVTTAVATDEIDLARVHGPSKLFFLSLS